VLVVKTKKRGLYRARYHEDGATGVQAGDQVQVDESPSDGTSHGHLWAVSGNLRGGSGVTCSRLSLKQCMLHTNGTISEPRSAVARGRRTVPVGGPRPRLPSIRAVRRALEVPQSCSAAVSQPSYRQPLRQMDGASRTGTFRHLSGALELLGSATLGGTLGGS
jgi:hypothetical protein